MGYLAKVGLNYPDPQNPGQEKRAEAGERCDDLPKDSIGWLLEQGYIEKVKDKKPAKDEES